MRLIHLVPWAFVIGLAAACGGSDSEGGSSGAGGDGAAAGAGSAAEGGAGSDGGGIALADVPARYAAAACQVYTTCIGELLTLFRPGEDCETNTTIQLTDELAGLQARVDAGRIVYDGTKLQACLDDVAAMGCELLTERAPPSCELALQGTVAEGGDCQLDEECEGEQYCKLTAACPGTCTLLEQAGGPCSGSSDCVSGLTCGDTGRCVAPAQPGEPCKGGEPDCTGGYLCMGNDDDSNTPGRCQEIASTFSGKPGDACSLADTLCAAGYVCEITMANPVGGTCAAKVGAGDACQAAFPDPCPDDEFCLLTGMPTPYDGTCTPKPKALEPCGKGLAPEPTVCAPYTRCDAGMCRPIARLGEECSVKETCYSERCVDGACVAANSCE
jgi:hypothetical protein